MPSGKKPIVDPDAVSKLIADAVQSQLLRGMTLWFAVMLIWVGYVLAAPMFALPSESFWTFLGLGMVVIGLWVFGRSLRK